MPMLNLVRNLVWIVVRGFVLGVFLLIGCTESSPPTSTTPTAPGASQPPRSLPSADVSIRFTDVSTTAGIDFRHAAGATGRKWYPETMGAGGGFFDYDGDGWVDILLVNGRGCPGSADPRNPPCDYTAIWGMGILRMLPGKAASMYRCMAWV